MVLLHAKIIKLVYLAYNRPFLGLKITQSHTSVGPTQLEVVNGLSGFVAKRTHECIVKHDGAMYGFVETLTSRVVVFLHVDRRGLAILKIKK